MSLLRRFPFLVFMLALLSIAGLCAAQRSMGIFLVAGTLGALSWYVTEGPRGRTLPRWVSNVLVLGVSLNVFVDLFHNSADVLGVLGRFAVWLTLIKLYDRRTARDHAHLLVLSVLLMMTGCLRADDLLFGCILGVYVVLGLYVLLLHQLFAAFEEAREARQAVIPEEHRLVPPLRPILGRHAELHFRTLAVGVGIVGVIVSAIVFIAFPRGIGAQIIGSLPAATAARKTQFSWTIDLNVGGRITDSLQKVLTVQVTDAQGRIVHDALPLHLRGAVLDEYQGNGRWRSAEGELLGRASDPQSLLASAAVPPGAIIQKVTLNRAASGKMPLFSLYAPIAWATNGGDVVFYDRQRRIIRTSEEAGRVGGYTVISAPDSEPGNRRGSRGEGGQRIGRGGWFRDVNGQVGTLAQSVLAAAGIPPQRPRGGEESWRWNQQAARALCEHLQNGAYVYTTDLSTVVRGSMDEDPIVRFLLTSKRGHCEYFASGFVALCQSVGVPARVVAGYLAHEYDEASQRYIVLERNAHAWAEVATGENAWSTFDPTPPAMLQAMPRAEPTFADTLRNFYQSFEGEWSTTVIGFDSAAQSRMANSFSQRWSARFRAALETIGDWMEEVNNFFNVGPGGYIWMGIVAFALIIAIVALIKLARRSLAIRRALQLHHAKGRDYQVMVRQLGFYLDMLNVLKRGGCPKPLWQPPQDFAAALARRRPAAGSLVASLTEMFYAARYGREPLQPEHRERARMMVEQLALLLKANPS